MEDVLEKAQKMVYNRWPKSTVYNPLKPSKLNCPAPFFLNIIARYCYEKCVKEWRILEIKKSKLYVAFVPVWVCENLSDRKKKNKWKLKVLLAKSDENYAYVIGDCWKPYPNILLVGTVEMTYVPYIGESRVFDESMLLQMEYVYGGYYVNSTVVDTKVLEIRKMCEIQPEFEKPEIHVPPMCERIMPAVQTDDLPETLQKLLKKEFDSDCSTNFKFLNWYLADCRQRVKNSGFFGITKKPILPPEYKRML